jgi:hypothetical protein
LSYVEIEIEGWLFCYIEKFYKEEEMGERERRVER